MTEDAPLPSHLGTPYLRIPKARLKLGIDQGTQNSSISYSFTHVEYLDDKFYTAGEPTNARSMYLDSRHRSIAAVVQDLRSDHTVERKIVFRPEAERCIKRNASKSVDNLKLCLIDESVPGIDKYAEMLGGIHEKHQQFLRSLGDQREVNMYSPFDGEQEVIQINSMADVLRAFATYLLDVAKLSIKGAYGLTNTETRQIFQQKTDVAWSVPAAWTSSMIDEQHLILGDAGYPTTTKIFAEAKSAAAFIARSLATKHGRYSQKVALRRAVDLYPDFFENKVLMILDSGRSTTDLVCVRVIETTPQFRLREVAGSGIGSLCGSYRWNDILTSKIMWHMSEEIKEICHHQKLLEADLIESISDGFDKQKHDVDQNHTEYWIEYKCAKNGASEEDRRFWGAFACGTVRIQKLVSCQIQRVRVLTCCRWLMDEALNEWSLEITELVKRQYALAKPMMLEKESLVGASYLGNPRP